MALYGSPVTKLMEAWCKDHMQNPGDPAWEAWMSDFMIGLGVKGAEMLEEHSNGGKFGMSKAGGCTRATVLKFLGAKEEPLSGSNKMTFLTGHLLEVSALTTFKAAGFICSGGQEPVVLEPFMHSYMDEVCTGGPIDLPYPFPVSVKTAGYKMALAIDTPVQTDRGWVAMGDIEPGDFVRDENGAAAQVIYASPIYSNNDCYRVTFRDGSSITCDGDHLWQVESRIDRGYNSQKPRRLRFPKVRSTREMVGCFSGQYRVPLAGSVTLDEQALPIDPYVLGAWLGDGTSSSPVLACGPGDHAILDEIESRGIHVERRLHVAHRLGLPGNGSGLRNSWMDDIRALGVVGNKHIPNAYLAASIDQRIDLLKGLMDTDGHCRTNGGCVFTTTIPAMAAQVRQLVASLGMRASVSDHASFLHGVEHKRAYKVSFTPHMPVFTLARKLARQKKGSQGTHYRHIRSITPVPSVDVRCIKVDSPAGLFLAGRDYIVTHNSGKIPGRKGDNPSDWNRRGITALPFGGVRLEQPSWYAQQQAEMHAKGYKHSLLLAVAKDMIKAFENDPWMGYGSEEANGSLTFFSQMIPYNQPFCEQQLLPAWQQAWDSAQAGTPGRALYLNNERDEYAELAIADEAWQYNKSKSGTFNPCNYCNLFTACKASLAKEYVAGTLPRAATKKPVAKPRGFGRAKA